MGITAEGKILLLKSFVDSIQSITFICSQGKIVKNCPLLCRPNVQEQTIKIIANADAELCKQANIEDNKTKFIGYTLNHADTVLYQSSIKQLTKPANAGLIITLELKLGSK